MKPAAFTYFKPHTLAEALTLINSNAEDAKILAGGQSLVPAMNFRLARPGMLIDINEIEALDFIRTEGDGLVIGALTRHATFHRVVADSVLGRLLNRVVGHIAHYPIRQRGTFGGSLSHADPASEWCLVARTLGADIVISSIVGERVVPVAEFFRSTFVTALKPDEILTEIRFPPLPAGWTFGFYEFSRRAGDFALAMALCALRVEGGIVREARIGLGGVADRPLRLDALEAEIAGKPADADTFGAIADRARAMVEPTEDIHGSARYRSDLIGTVIRRALAQALP